MAAHTPISVSDGIVDCTCGHRQEGVYATSYGARIGYFEHLLTAVAAEQGWPDEFWPNGQMAERTPTPPPRPAPMPNPTAFPSSP